MNAQHLQNLQQSLPGYGTCQLRLRFSSFAQGELEAQKTTVIFIDFSGCCRQQRGKKKTTPKNSVFFGGVGQNMTKWYKMPLTACNSHCRLSGQWSGCGNLGAFGGKGIVEISHFWVLHVADIQIPMILYFRDFFHQIVVQLFFFGGT